MVAQFVRYAVSGGIATLTDWGVFYVAWHWAHVHYQLATVCAVSSGALVNYVLSKVFVFQCTSRRVIEQLGVYACITGLSLIANMGIMYVLVQLADIPAMVSRVLATALLLVANYLMHKLVTFNPRVFTPHGR